jgi:spore maturation protein CgeB
MRIIFSFNKAGREAEYWEKEISAASSGDLQLFPFNHGAFLDPSNYSSALALDRLYQNRDARLFSMYGEFERLLKQTDSQAVIVANAPPYHPDYLKGIAAYKVLYSADDPGATYLINIPYLHAYNHVFFVAPTYSADMDMKEKMAYAGMTNADWLPISVFDFEHDATATEEEVFSRPRDIDVIYVGGFWRQKLPILARVKRAMGKGFKAYGFFNVKHNLFINGRYGFGGWVSPVSLEQRVALYQRSKLGFNIHWNEHGLGNQRLYHLPANGVMQLSDCAADLHRIYEPDREIVGYREADDLIDLLRFYLRRDEQRLEIARNGYRRTMRDYRFKTVVRLAGTLIRQGMDRIQWAR